MNVGIIGSGNIGANAARLFAGAGHDVPFSNSRGPRPLESLVAEIGPKPVPLPSRRRIPFGRWYSWRSRSGATRP